MDRVDLSALFICTTIAACIITLTLTIGSYQEALLAYEYACRTMEVTEVVILE